MTTVRKTARVLFDEAHSEAWTIRPEIARAIQPSHPDDSSLALAAASLAAREFEVAAHTDGPLTAQTLAAVSVLVIAHPSDPRWEATVDGGSPRLGDEEIDAIDAFVEAGGGLIVLAETEQEKYGNNVAELVGRFGIGIENATVQDYEHHHGDAPSWVLAALDRRPGTAGDGPGFDTDPLAGVHEACFYRSGALTAANGARVIARAHPTASLPEAALAAVASHGAGRVVVLADSDLFGDDCIGELDHETLWRNLVYWAAEPSFAAPAAAPASPAASDPAWLRLRAAVSELRLTQSPDGSVDTSAHDRGGARAPRRDDRRLVTRPWRRAFRTRAPTSRRWPPTCAPGPTAAMRSRTSSARPRPSAPSSSAATGSSTCACFRCTSRTPHATSASRR